ncbi:MAG: hypothetical protein PUK76_03895, partial [Treponema sp.]|nr:hypothetical protein [Treponema sp.]
MKTISIKKTNFTPNHSNEINNSIMTLKHTILLFALSTSLALAAQNKTYLKIKEYFKATLAEQQAEI